MILTCDKCGREYRFPDNSIKGLVLLNGPHDVLPIGKGCDGILRSNAVLPSTEIDFRGISRNGG